MGGSSLIFPNRDGLFFFIYVCVSQTFQKDPVSLEELRNITPLVGLACCTRLIGRLWTMNQQIFATFRCDGGCTVLE